MSGRKGWMAAVAAIALALVGTSVMIVGTALREPGGRGEGRRDVRRAEAAGADTGVTRGGAVPRGQATAVALTVPRFQNAFNAEAGNRRLLILLSPT
jgi:hypothetical protein